MNIVMACLVKRHYSNVILPLVVARIPLLFSILSVRERDSGEILRFWAICL